MCVGEAQSIGGRNFLLRREVYLQHILGMCSSIQCFFFNLKMQVVVSFW